MDNNGKKVKVEEIELTGKENILSLFGVKEIVTEYKKKPYIEKSLLEYLYKFPQPYPDNVKTYIGNNSENEIAAYSECCIKGTCKISYIDQVNN